tara:strand:- start:265 stop:483 length:219 start_codon:yes stop_codon:yes gene_type:complete
MQQKGIGTEDIRTNNRIRAEKLWRATQQINEVIKFNVGRIENIDITEDELDYLLLMNGLLRIVVKDIQKGGY